MIHIRQAVIVEGKYDKITLENVIDGLIIPTNGFRIFRDREKCELIRTLAMRDGVIVLTDSDSAGQMIRSYLKKIVGTGKIINVYIPQLSGKEKRKSAPGKEGLLGVEGMKPDIIADAFRRSGITDFSSAPASGKITKQTLFSLGLSGNKNSAAERRELLTFLKLPCGLSSSAMLDLINAVFTESEFLAAVKRWRNENDECNTAF